MARNPYAAEDFIAQVGEDYSKAKIERHGDPDGLGVYRSFVLDKNTSKRLGKALSVLDDERIESVSEEDGQVVVTFSPRTVADQRGRFALAEAQTVADAE